MHTHKGKVTTTATTKMLTCLILILTATVHASSKADNVGNSSIGGSHYLLKLDGAGSKRSARCTPCSTDDRPVPNHLDPEYRGNGADNLGYDWSPRAWGGPAFSSRSKMRPMDTWDRGRGGRQMNGNWDSRGNCDRCRTMMPWDQNRFDQGNNNNFSPRMGSWQQDDRDVTRVTSPPIALRPEGRIAYVPSPGGEMYWDGVSGGGTRWDGFSNGISWLGGGRPYENGGNWGNRGYQQTRPEEYGRPWGKGPGTGPGPGPGSPSWYYPGKGYGDRGNMDQDMRYNGYASQWHYGTTNQNGWNGNNMKWSYGGKNWDNNPRDRGGYYPGGSHSGKFDEDSNPLPYGQGGTVQYGQGGSVYYDQGNYIFHYGQGGASSSPQYQVYEPNRDGNRYPSGGRPDYPERPRPTGGQKPWDYNGNDRYDNHEPGYSNPNWIRPTYPKEPSHGKFPPGGGYDDKNRRPWYGQSGGRPDQGYPPSGGSGYVTGSVTPGGYPSDRPSGGGYPQRPGGSGGYPSGGSGYPRPDAHRPGGSGYPRPDSRPGGYPGSTGGSGYPGPSSGGSYPAPDHHRPGGYSGPSSGGSSYQGPSSGGGGYPGPGSGGSGYPGPSSGGSGYPGPSSGGSGYPSGGSVSPQRPGGYPGPDQRPGGYPAPDRYPGPEHRPGGYPAPSGGGGYPGPDQRPGGYPAPSGGGGYPGPNPGSRYPGPSTGSGGYQRPGSGGGYPGSSGGGGYPGSSGGGTVYPGSSGGGGGYPRPSNGGGGYPGSGAPYPGPDHHHHRPGGYPSGGYGQDNRPPPKGYYTGFITELEPNDKNSVYLGHGGGYPSGGSYPIRDKDSYPGYGDRDRYPGGSGDRDRYPGGGDRDRYPSGGGDRDRYPGGGGDGYGGYQDRYNQGGNRYPDDRYRPGSSDGDGPGGGGGGDDGAWNYGQETHKDGIYRRAGGSYPPYRGGQYYTSSYLASASTPAGASQSPSESKTQTVTKVDEVTKPTPQSA